MWEAASAKASLETRSKTSGRFWYVWRPFSATATQLTIIMQNQRYTDPAHSLSTEGGRLYNHKSQFIPCTEVPLIENTPKAALIKNDKFVTGLTGFEVSNIHQSPPNSGVCCRVFSQKNDASITPKHPDWTSKLQYLSFFDKARRDCPHLKEPKRPMQLQIADGIGRKNSITPAQANLAKAK